MFPPAALPVVADGKGQMLQGKRRRSVSWATGLLLLLPVGFLTRKQQSPPLQRSTDSVLCVLPLLLLYAISIAFKCCWRSIRSSSAETTRTCSSSESTCTTTTNGYSRGGSDCRCGSICNGISSSDSSNNPRDHSRSSLPRSRENDGTDGFKWDSVCSSRPSSSRPSSSSKDNKSRYGGRNSRTAESGETSSSKGTLPTGDSRRSAICSDAFHSPRLWRRCSNNTRFLLFCGGWWLQTVFFISEATRTPRMYSSMTYRHLYSGFKVDAPPPTAEELAQQWDALPPANRQLEIRFERDDDGQSSSADAPPPAVVLYFSPATPEDALPAALIDFTEVAKQQKEQHEALTAAQSRFVSIAVQRCLWSALSMTTFLAVTDFFWSLKESVRKRKAKEIERRRVWMRTGLHRELQALEKELERMEPRLDAALGGARAHAGNRLVTRRLSNIVYRLKTVLIQLRRARGTILEVYGTQLLDRAKRLLRQHTQFSKGGAGVEKAIEDEESEEETEVSTGREKRREETPTRRPSLDNAEAT